MGPHLNTEQIDRYVRHDAPFTELMESAQHVDECASCRKVVAAHEGTEDSGPVFLSGPFPTPSQDLRAFVWLAVFIVLMVTATVLLLTHK